MTFQFDWLVTDIPVFNQTVSCLQTLEYKSCQQVNHLSVSDHWHLHWTCLCLTCPCLTCFCLTCLCLTCFCIMSVSHLSISPVSISPVSVSPVSVSPVYVSPVCQIKIQHLMRLPQVSHILRLRCFSLLIMKTWNITDDPKMKKHVLCQKKK